MFSLTCALIGAIVGAALARFFADSLPGDVWPTKLSPEDLNDIEYALRDWEAAWLKEADRPGNVEQFRGSCLALVERIADLRRRLGRRNR